MSSQLQQQILEQNDGAPDLEEVGEIEEEVNQMADRIAEYRGKISVQLKITVSSILTAQRPVLGDHFDDGSESQSASSTDVGGPIESGNIALLAREEQKEAEKVQVLKQKISENASAIPVVLTRIKECMKRIDKLQLRNGVIHPAFKRKQTF